MAINGTEKQGKLRALLEGRAQRLAEAFHLYRQELANLAEVWIELHLYTRLEAPKLRELTHHPQIGLASIKHITERIKEIRIAMSEAIRMAKEEDDEIREWGERLEA